MAELTPELTRLREETQRLAEVPMGIAQAGLGLEDTLRLALAEHPEAARRREETAGLASTFYQAPDVARERFRDITDPFRRASMVSGIGGAALQDFIRAGEALKAMQGDFETAITAPTQRLQALQNVYGLRSQIGQQAYENLLNEYIQGQQLQMQREQLAIQRSQAAQDKTQPLSELEKLQLLGQKRATYATLERSLSTGEEVEIPGIGKAKISSPDDLRTAILGYQQDPDDPFFQGLYSKATTVASQPGMSWQNLIAPLKTAAEKVKPTSFLEKIVQSTPLGGVLNLKKLFTP